MTTYSMMGIDTLPMKLGQRYGEVVVCGAVGVVLPLVVVRAGEGGGGGDDSVVDYSRV